MLHCIKCHPSFRNCDEKWSILHTNIRGYDSKAFSFHTIIDAKKPSVITVNETYFKNNRKMKLQGYSCFNRNRQCVNGGGIATCVESKDAMHTLKVFEGEDNDEIMITRHSQFVVPINVVNMYVDQECRASKDAIVKKWEKVLNEITKIEAKAERIVIIGDLNRHIGDIVKGNENDKVSFGGLLVRELLETGNYVLVNASNKVKGGPFTRYDPAYPGRDDKKSVLDL